MNFLVAQLALIFFNCLNVYIDAYRILKHKNIAHGINFTAYCVFIIFCVLRFDIHVLFLFGFMPFSWELLTFIVSAFANRQISFDIPLNWRRGLPWYYQSTANPPKAFWDRIERRLFGNGVHVGEDIVWAYCCLWCLCINIKIWLLW